MRRAVQVLSIFSVLWFALAAFSHHPAWHLPAFAMIGPVGLLLWSSGGRINERSPAELRAAMQHVKIWSIAEGVAIVVVLFFLAKFHLSQYALAAVIEIVGLHFLPLAHRLFEPRYYWLAAAMIGIAVWTGVGTDRDIMAAALAGIALFLGALSLAVKGVRRGPQSAIHP